jgi:hypothetical protein
MGLVYVFSVTNKYIFESSIVNGCTFKFKLSKFFQQLHGMYVKIKLSL